MPETSPQPNEPAARTPDGTLIDQGLGTSPTEPTTPPTSSTPTEPTPDGKSTEPAPDAPKPDPVPDSYVFKAPEGQSFDPAIVEQASAVFKELGLTQAQADKLIALQPKLAQSSTDQAIAVIREMDKGFEAKLKADPDMGDKLDDIRADIGRAFNQHLTPARRDAFAKAMFATGLGNHPDITYAVWQLAKAAGPGTHVTGSGPSKLGQIAPGESARPSAAEALWPALPKAS